MLIKTSNKVLPDLSKLKPLEGTNYHCWYQKLLIFFKQLEVDYILTTDLPSNPPATTPALYDPKSSIGPSATAADQVIDPAKCAKDNKTVRRHLLNHKSDPMFDVFGAKNLLRISGPPWNLDTEEMMLGKKSTLLENGYSSR
ncbi:ty1-copia retrotransposon protein [Cucumis melo var. makuwa]|uniref:Ty1-copia retrotransposon protein n=1 Tax=Cucumis melo var. makuwa TaxID=1194695 RepID=A0A5D3D9V0_CUCMM|nr:ty1-copia retrotransposon protein [Cucumis melo var. makuwa]TYK20351.1 ty1-copia retrotransposon protein [Cucumis melo var. makuwa]